MFQITAEIDQNDTFSVFEVKVFPSIALGSFCHLSSIRNFIAKFVEGIHDDFKGFYPCREIFQVLTFFKEQKMAGFCADVRASGEESVP